MVLMINGLPGAMAKNVALSALDDDRFELIRQSLTGPDITDQRMELKSIPFDLIPPENHSAAIDRIKEKYEHFMAVDYTHPSAVNINADLYCGKSVYFVMGTTGGDRTRLMDCVKNSSIAAVIAPNMAKQIVGFQAMLEYAASTFPGIFNGYSLQIRESHQKGKADTSGTAKSAVNSFNAMGIPFEPEMIEKERDPEKQRSIWRVPEQFLGGHGWHTYTLISDDGTVKFEFTHNVNGRDVYARGTMDAAAFLHRKMKQSEAGTVYSMIDVLKSAASA